MASGITELKSNMFEDKSDDTIKAALETLLVGQDHAIETIAGMVYSHISGIGPEGRPAGVVLLLGPTGSGKAQPLDAKVLTTSGWKLMGEIQVGEKVITPSNTVSTVTGVFPQGEKQLYEIEFADGRKTECCDEHLWEVFNQYNWGGEYRVKPLSFIRDYLSKKPSPNNTSRGLYVRLTEPLDFFKEDSDCLPMNPYALGLLLGNGGLTRNSSVNLSDGKPENALALAESLADLGAIVHQPLAKTGTCDYSVVGSVGVSKPAQNKTLNTLKTLDVHGLSSLHKSVPESYMKASAKNRLALIQGLMDTGGTVSKGTNNVSFSTSSKKLAEDFQYLIRSIGGCAKITSKIPVYSHKGQKLQGAKTYRVFIRHKDPKSLFRCSHHLNKLTTKYQYSDCLRLKIRSIKESRVALAQCIQIDSPDHLYITDDFIVTHNTRSVEALAQVLHGSPKQLVKIDCGEFQMEHEVAKLIGAPPGYLGHRETQPMLNQAKINGVVSDNSNLSIVLFDEIEKAAPSMTRLLLGILDKATLRLGDNSIVNFENCMIFMTSNLGADAMMKLLVPSFGYEAVGRPKSDEETLAEIVNNTDEEVYLKKLSKIGEEAVKRRFSPEFVNRIDEIITYKPLGKEATQLILDMTLEAFQKHLNKRLGAAANVLYFEDEAKEWLLENGISTKWGARHLKRLLHRTITIPLARQLTLKDIKPREDVHIGVDEGKLFVKRYDKRPRRRLAA